MLKLLVAVSLLGLVLGFPSDYPKDNILPSNYFETVGIPAAERIKAQEEAINFDGTRIVGGTAAALGEHPHMAGLVISLNGGFTAVCGASLLSSTKLTTAAHCWFDGSSQAFQFVVVLGSTTLFSGGTRAATSNVVMHPQWDPRTIMNDVAVITIGPVSFNNNIRPIGLATGNNDYVGDWAWAAGFGAQADGRPILTSQTLHHTSLRVISNSECNRWFPGSIHDSTLCIDGSDRRSTCGGDSGGPLAVNGNTLIGITSFGYRWGCEQGWPAAFARVSSFSSWITSNM